MPIVCVSGACSRAGKTALAETLLRALRPGAATAVKFTTTEDVFQRCPRGAPCVVCDIDVPYRIVEDESVLGETGTDTFRLGAAGARRVVWVIARRGAAGRAWAEVKRRVGEDLVVMEGSSIVEWASPDLLAFVLHPHLAVSRWKDTSPALIARADAVIVNRPRGDPRPPDAAVLAEARRHAGTRSLLVADVARPLAEWAPVLEGVLGRLAPLASAAS